MLLLQVSENTFAREFSYAVGGAVIIITAIAWYWQRRAGPTAEERKQMAAIEEGFSQVNRVEPIFIADYPAVEDVWIEIGHRLGGQIPMPRRRAVLARVRSLTGGRIVRCLQTTDADGQRLYLVEIDGIRLAHREQKALKTDVLTLLRAIRTGADPPATISEWYAEDIQEGRVDFDRSLNRARGDCKLRLEENLKREGELDIEELYHRLVHDEEFRYPPDVVAEKLDQLLDREVRLHRDGTLRYQRY